MSMGSVIAWWKQAGVSEHQDLDAAVEEACEAGFAFTAEELRRAHDLRSFLMQAGRRPSLKTFFRPTEGTAPASAAEITLAARDAGFTFEATDFEAVLEAERADQGRLDEDQLQAVSGGMYALPEVDDEVLVAFLQGDARQPVVLGSLWSGKDAPPRT